MADDFPRIPPGRGNVNAFRAPRAQLLKYRIDARGIDAQARKLSQIYRRRLGQTGGLIAKANRESVEWLKQRAQVNLEESIKENRRPQIRSRDEPSLAEVIGNDSSHTVFNAGFRFMVTKKVRPQIDYAFSLEYGDRSQIGREIKFQFYGSNATPREPFASFNKRSASTFEITRRFQPRSPYRGNAAMGVTGHYYEGAEDTVTDRIVGPREYNRTALFQGRRRTRVKIKNPVPQYAYGRKAGRAFVSEQIYTRKLLEIFGAGGGNVEGIRLAVGNIGANTAINALNKAVSQNSGRRR